MSDVLDPAPARLETGTRLNGIFEIDRLIASGGMGDIYRGHAIETGDPVAIKVMRTDLVDNAMALALFRKEASALHSIQHEAIVRYYLSSSDPATRRHYLAMEFIGGEPLSELIKRAPLNFEEVQRLQHRLAAGLDAAHRHGIIHRDLSPDNVLVPDGDVGRAKIIDFGIARSTRAGAGTIIGSGFAGKYNYVSPEQVGLFGGEVTGRSDIYSLGLVLVECLAGRPLDMGGSQLEVIDKRRVVPPLDGIDPRYRPLLQRMLQPDPKDRPQSMAEVAEWEPPRAPLLRGPGSVLKASAQPVRNAAPAPRYRRAKYAIAALVLLAGIGGALFIPGLIAPVPVITKPPDLDPGAGRQPPDDDGTLDPKERINRFVNAYDGGDCFLVTPTVIAEDQATLEGYSRSEAPFERLDSDFTRQFGYEALIGVHEVTPAQCAAVNFLWRMRTQRGAAPRLVIGADRIKSGDNLTGTVTAFGDRHVDLLLVSDDGNVENLSGQLHAQGEAKTFGIAPQGAGSAARLPQLLIAIAASRPLEALKSAPLGGADQVFPRLLAEAQRSGQAFNVGFKYFMLER